MEEKKKRAPNFSQFEVGILLELVGNSASILENKSTDGSSLREKQATWLDLTSQFNAVPGVTKRSTQNLKVCYENLKRRLRKDLADEKVETYKTGGGKKNIKTTNIDPKLLEIMGHSVRPLQNAFDSDTSYQGDVLYDGSLSVVTTQYEVPSTSTAPEMEPVEQASTVSATVIQDITQRVNVQTPVDMVSPNIFQEKEVAHSKTPASSKQYQWNRRRMPQKPKPSCDAVADTFTKRINCFPTEVVDQTYSWWAHRPVQKMGGCWKLLYMQTDSVVHSDLL
ncbi:uncharacterized protein [Periplaneta americana]|uniref:uncharacterized protein n=1 Tax=Periplaneta americana TaxID=6978 RepID=UPI0037E93D4E